MKSPALLAMAFALGAVPALAQDQAPAAGRARPAPQANWWSGAGREDGPTRMVWAAHKSPETP